VEDKGGGSKGAFQASRADKVWEHSLIYVASTGSLLRGRRCPSEPAGRPREQEALAGGFAGALRVDSMPRAAASRRWASDF
jgi:hypothetical protein